MIKPARVTVLVLLAVLGACGGDADRREREAMKPEDTAVGDLVTAPERVKQEADAAIAGHREALNRRLQEDEGQGQDGK